MGKIKKHSPEQRVSLLRQIEVAVANGKTHPIASREAGITEQTYYRWRKEYGGPDGRPEHLFNRATGVIDANVAAYWRTHYDIVEYLNNNWGSLAPDLRGKYHFVVGTDDTFYLDGAAHSLESTLKRLGGESHFTFLPGRSHFNVYVEGDDRWALFDKIAAEMYQAARPRN